MRRGWRRILREKKVTYNNRLDWKKKKRKLGVKNPKSGIVNWKRESKIRNLSKNMTGIAV